MRTIVLVLSLAGCWRTEYVHVPVVRKITVYEPVPCLTQRPPEPPKMSSCDSLSVEDCNDLHNAELADYAATLELWARVYAWPQCQQR
jgi:hypothetical protein